VTLRFLKKLVLMMSPLSSNRFEKYKGRKGYTDRISMIHLKDGKPIVQKAKVHYIEGVGNVIANDYTIAKFGEPTLKFATIVGVYRTDKFGKLEKPVSLQAKYFVFNAPKYEALRKANSEFPLDKHDLLSSCAEEQYQQLSFQSCKEAVWQMPEAKIKELTLSQVEKLAKYLEGQLGQKLTPQQIKEKLGESDGAPASEETALDADSVIASL
jgi:hypothetical protein